MTRIAFVLLLVALAPRIVRAQESATVRGTLTETVTLRADSTQTAAIYLPPGYGADRRWPVLFLMDPRGRAMIPVGLFRDAAERYGYIIISSYNTLSDGPPEPNVRALDAMLQEVQERFAVDEHRFYLVGFSGTARVSWEFALQLAGNVAGVIGAGAGLARPIVLLQMARMKPVPFAFYGTAGRTDFNYDEVRALDDRLDELSIPHHVEYFDGGHQWMPHALATRGVEWMELQAMRTGLRPRDQALVDSLRSAWLAEAAALERTDPAEAWRTYVRVAADFADFGDVADARAKAEALEKTRVVRQVRERSRELASRDSAYNVKVVEYLREVRARPQPPAMMDIERELELDALLRDAAHKDDPLRAAGAQRRLERAFVYLAFYEPRAYLEAGQERRAIALLRVANRIKPDNVQVCVMLARAYLGDDDRRRALESLECAVKNSRIGAAQLEQDSTFTALREDEGFRGLLDRMRAEGRP